MKAFESYDKKLFILPPNDLLECPICCNIMKDPVLCTAQGHTFCRFCVTKALYRSETCPTCREPLKRLVCSLIEDAEVHCFSYEFAEEDKVKGRQGNIRESYESCEWSGKLKDAESHYKQCQFAQINCPHDGCHDIIVRKDLTSHIVDCIHRLLPCKWCGLEGSANLLDAHLLICDGRHIPCPKNCLDVHGEVLSFPWSEITSHRTICEMESVGCAFAEGGCKVKLPRKDMPLHEKDAGAHMVCLFGALKTAQEKNDLFEKDVGADMVCLFEALHEKIVKLEQLVTEQNKVMERLVKEQSTAMDFKTNELKRVAEAQVEVIERLDNAESSQISFKGLFSNNQRKCHSQK
jgi:hypothetical protein